MALAYASPETEIGEDPIKSFVEALGQGTDADQAACLAASTACRPARWINPFTTQHWQYFRLPLKTFWGGGGGLRANSRKRDIHEPIEGALADKIYYPWQVTGASPCFYVLFASMPSRFSKRPAQSNVFVLIRRCWFLISQSIHKHRNTVVFTGNIGDGAQANSD
ncbi:hypothetical protein ROS1_60400 [Roseibium sp. ROS1]